MKPRIWRSSWKNFVSTHKLVVFFLVVFGPCFSSMWNSQFLLHALALTHLFLTKVRFLFFLTHQFHNLVTGTDSSVYFPIGGRDSGKLLTFGAEVIFCYSTSSVCSRFLDEACAVPQSFCSLHMRTGLVRSVRSF